MKRPELATALLLSPLAVFGGTPGLLLFALGTSAHAAVSVARDLAADESKSRQRAAKLRDISAKLTSGKGDASTWEAAYRESFDESSR